MPAYERIRTDIAHQIASRVIEAGDRLPSEDELARHYGVTRMTVRHALDHLVTDGLIKRRWGVGTFVLGALPPHRTVNRLQSLTEELTTAGKLLTTKIVEQLQTSADGEIAEKLDLEPGASVVSLRRLRSLDGRPVAVQHSWVPMAVCPTLSRAALINGSLYATLTAEAGVALGAADQVVTAIGADHVLSELLQVRKGAALIHTERVTFDAGGRPVEFARSWTAPDLPIVMRLSRAPKE